MSKKLTTEQFIQKAQKAHGTIYDYSKVEYVNAKTKVKIICKKHGVFEQTPDNHLQGKKCIKCAIKDAKLKRTFSLNEFIRKANKKHNNKYTYNKVNYINSKTKVTITCSIHGDFEQSPNSHLRGDSCSKCKRNKKKTSKEFILEATEKHKGKYSYKNTIYTRANDKVIVTCPVHGDFEQSANSHLQGNGCSKCHTDKISKMYKDNKEVFIQKAQKIHENKYDYSLVEYKNSNTKVKIICKEHGLFEQTPNAHLQGQGCPKCGKEVSVINRKHTIEDFIKRGSEVHNEKYDYSLSEYNKLKEKLDIICPTHGIFRQEGQSHLNGSGCPKCSNSGEPSKAEQEVYDFVNCLVEAKQSNRSILEGKELDIYIPSKKLAIEFNGLYWHSDEFKKDTYHINKTKQCQEKGIQLIHIFEDEWLNKKEIVKSRLMNLLSITETRIFARKTEIKLVETKEKSKFLDQNHIQGKVGSNINLGLYYENELVSLMTFGKLRKNLGSNHKEGHYELLRFCNKLNTSVVGGFSKLLKHFQRNYEYKEIISYCDLRWSTGNVYEKNGFEEISRSKPNYFYVNRINREPRFKYRKSELLKWGWGTKDQTEKEIMQERGFLRIYDCGTIKFSKNK